MNSKIQYRDGDFDLDRPISKTVSWPDGLNENYRFVPNLVPKIRRTSSVDEISRYDRYYRLMRTNLGNMFTWRHYLQILRNELRNINMAKIVSKMMLHYTTPSPSCTSMVSHYVTATESECSRKQSPRLATWRKRRDVFGGDNESITSVDSNVSITPQANLLKKMCTEIRTLAHRTCKTVEKLSSRSKYCSACGYYMGSSKFHKKCSQSFGDGIRYKPLTPDGIKITKTVRTRSVTFISPMKTPSGSGEFSGEIQASSKQIIKEVKP